MSKKISLPSASSPNEYLEFLKKEIENPNFENWLDEIAEKAIAGDKTIWSFLYQAIRDADSGRLSWGFHKKLLSGIFHVLARIGDSQAYRLLINYVKSLDRTIPIGALELISDLVPTFREIDVNEILNIAAHPDSLKSAFGVLALSQLVIENRLPTEKTEETKRFLESYRNDNYFLNDIIERTLEFMEAPDSNLLSFVEELAAS
ncbi:hypothetical protein LEP1GSC050_3790 [Leptospira broomii serovar Hurstbridge str. 5399]|uniref:HEAT repeat protein n=1 Tax=Leptospira broomii serovar Hurstbridge str. 5399 TaxID=1049789 RepID=T0GGJ6_9LEPT|nr:hypothetical protein [Leptospira broomii]EQA45984.1 hypothetical protein LEP1GSC050_3790 [Leptospira broomii serovar Hurstbridge str. 5399]